MPQVTTLIYCLKIGVHYNERDIYKIGLTTRTPDVRANDLSRTSGVIDYFAVMQDWEVTDCVTAEKEIHKRLAPFRVTDRREFFKVQYKEIFSVIHDVVEAINNAAKAGKQMSFTEGR